MQMSLGRPSTQWEAMMRKFSNDIQRSKPQCLKREMNRTWKTQLILEKSFGTGSTYKGGWDSFGMCGYGTYTFPNGVIYKGEFNDNAFHGDGELQYPDGTVIKGNWKNGELCERSIIFADGVHYSDQGWTYCMLPDRRFSIEYYEGLQPAPVEYLTASQPPREIPPGYYDVGDGLYSADTKSVFHYDDITSMIRCPSEKVQKWIVKNCRCNSCKLPGPKPGLYEKWAGPELCLDAPPRPSCLPDDPELSEETSLKLYPDQVSRSNVSPWVHATFAFSPNTNRQSVSKSKSSDISLKNNKYPVRYDWDATGKGEFPKMTTVSLDQPEDTEITNDSFVKNVRKIRKFSSDNKLLCRRSLSISSLEGWLPSLNSRGSNVSSSTSTVSSISNGSQKTHISRLNTKSFCSPSKLDRE